MDVRKQAAGHLNGASSCGKKHVGRVQAAPHRPPTFGFMGPQALPQVRKFQQAICLGGFFFSIVCFLDLESPQ
eukprot:1159584-Pelagomonas_calceolata.AAC.7